jgi:hypothetical protein
MGIFANVDGAFVKAAAATIEIGSGTSIAHKIKFGKNERAKTLTWMIRAFSCSISSALWRLVPALRDGS